MAIEIARSNEVPGALGGSRGRSGSSDSADGGSSFASALASADREPNADVLAASRPARSNDAAIRDRNANSNRDRNGDQGDAESQASSASDADVSNATNNASTSSAARDAAARIDARTSDGSARIDSGKDRDGARRDAVSSSATDTSSNAASSTPTASTAAADTSALLLAQSNLTAVSASSALDAGAAAAAAAAATGAATLALAQAQQAANRLPGAGGKNDATALSDNTVAGVTGAGSASTAATAAIPATATAGTDGANAVANPQDALAAQNTTTQRAAAPTIAASGIVRDTGTVDSHAAGLGVALLDRGNGKKDGVKDLSRTAATQDASALARSPTSTAATAAASASADAAAASRAGVPTTATPATEPVALAQAAAASIPGEGASPWRRIERPGDASTPSAGAGSLGFDATGSASSSTASTDAAAAAANAGTGSAEFMERMVDQVSWWMAHRSQGAELKLDLPGGQPVSVSVQVQGNEAQVAFRSDHPEARQWLNAAMPQLKEMLGNEGLMLSGSSVGQSGSGAEQEAARDAQRAWRSENGGSASTASSAIDTSMTTAARPRTVSERALDLYV